MCVRGGGGGRQAGWLPRKQASRQEGRHAGPRRAPCRSARRAQAGPSGTSSAAPCSWRQTFGRTTAPCWCACCPTGRVRQSRYKGTTPPRRGRPRSCVCVRVCCMCVWRGVRGWERGGRGGSARRRGGRHGGSERARAPPHSHAHPCRRPLTRQTAPLTVRQRWTGRQCRRRGESGRPTGGSPAGPSTTRPRGCPARDTGRQQQRGAGGQQQAMSVACARRLSCSWAARSLAASAAASAGGR